MPDPSPEGPLTKHRQQIIEYIRQSLTFTLFDTKWIPSSARFVAVGNYPKNTGCIFVYQLDGGKLKTLKELERPNPIKCCTFGQSPEEERHVAMGDFKGNLEIWDVEQWGKPLLSIPAHNLIINGIDGALHTGPPELATASRDGSVKVWDVRQKDNAVAILEPSSPETARDCWCVTLGNSYNKQERVVAAGYDNGDVKLFDLRTMKMHWQTNISNGVCGIDFDRPDIQMNKLLVSSLEGRVRVYDLRTLHPTLGYSYLEERCHAGTVWGIKSLPQNREVFMSCANGELGLHRYEYPKQRSITDHEGHKKGVMGNVDTINRVSLTTQPICCFDWSKARQGLACLASFDQTVRVVIVTKLDLIA